jgi:hypothetical protein
MEMHVSDLKTDGFAMTGERYLGMTVIAYYAVEDIEGVGETYRFASHWSTLPEHRNPVRLFDEYQIKDIRNLRHILNEMGYAIVPLEPSETKINKMNDAYWRKRSDIMSQSPTEEPSAGGGPMGYAYRAMISEGE